MSNGMQLSGLASGMDWQNVVDQLMELERIPIKRKEAEQLQNAEKSAEFDMLKVRLEQLESSAGKLADDQLWDARTTTLSDPETTLISASAATGTLIGDYVVSDATRATASVLYGEADIADNIGQGATPDPTLSAMNVSTAVKEGSFTINGTIIEIGGTSPDINLTDTISSVATTIGAQVSGVTAQVDAASGKLVLESNSEIVLGHADDTSNFLGVMKLFSQSEPNYDSISGYYSKTEAATATTTSNFYRQGEYLWNGSNYFEALQDVSRGTDISSIPDSNFGSVKQVDSITGLAGDTPVAEVKEVTIAGGVGDIFNYNIGGGVISLTAATANPAAEIATAINADPVLSASETGGVITVTGASDGTSFTLTANVNTDNTGSAAVTGLTTNTNGITGDTFTINVDGVGAQTLTLDNSGTVGAQVSSFINTHFGGLVTPSVISATEVQVEGATAGTPFTLTISSSNPDANGVVGAAGSNATNGPTTYRSASEFAVGSFDVDDTIATVFGAGASTFTINDETISVTASTTLEQLMTKVNASGAGVSMSYNPIEDRFLITNQKTGSLNISASGGLLTSMGLVGGTSSFTKGTDATLTINGTTVTSNSNTVTGESHGVDGLSVEILDDFDSASSSDIIINVDDNTASAKATIDAFISDYNSVQAYIKGVTETSVSNDSVSTSIFSDNLEVSGLITSLRSAVFGNQDSINPDTLAGTGYQRIQDIGIDFVSGTSDLSVQDSSALNTALEEKGYLVKELFMSQAHTEVPDYYVSSKTYEDGDVVQSNGYYWKNSGGSTGTSPPSDPSTASATWSFLSYDDGVARQTEDSGGNLVTNGVAYGLAHRVTELINNFISGATPDPDDTEADGTITVQTNALQEANDRLDQDISNLETLLAQREQQMIDSFVRMEEMQSQLQNQSKMLESSIQNNFGSGKKK